MTSNDPQKPDVSDGHSRLLLSGQRDLSIIILFTDVINHADLCNNVDTDVTVPRIEVAHKASSGLGGACESRTLFVVSLVCFNDALELLRYHCSRNQGYDFVEHSPTH